MIKNIDPITKVYEEMPIEADIAPSTPKFSVVYYDFPAFDQGKELAHQKWVKLMQTTPTRLTFWNVKSHEQKDDHAFLEIS